MNRIERQSGKTMQGEGEGTRNSEEVWEQVTRNITRRNMICIIA